jgi:catechol 2,3-dioxygenase-like lactoylglutathione lyase family enzyme
MIRGMHGLFYSSDAEATRAFFRDVMRLPGKDVGGGWWIFDFAEADLGVHPIDPGSTAGGHDVSFYCDDIRGTVADLKSRGVHFDTEIEARGYGLVTYLTAPGGLRIQLYEPRYKTLGKPTAKRQRAVARKRARTAKADTQPAAKRKPTKRPRAAAKSRRPAAKPRTVGKRKPAARPVNARSRSPRR